MLSAEILLPGFPDVLAPQKSCCVSITEQLEQELNKV